MKQEKWLTDAIHEGEISTGVLNIVHAPTGSGKTTWAFNYLERTVSAGNKAVYLIDTVNGRDQLLRRDDTIHFNQEWKSDVLQDAQLFGEKRIVAMTYAKFGCLADEEPDFGLNFDVIICDEIHSLPRFSAFLNKNPADRPVHEIAKKQLERIIQKNRVRVIGLSATPDRAVRDMRCPTKRIPVDEDVRQLLTKEIRYYSGSWEQIIREQSPDSVGIAYVAHIRQMKQMQEVAERAGLRPIAIWSKNNTEHPMTEEQQEAREYIIANSRIPPQYNLLIINASSETSINIYGKVDYMLIHSQEEEPRVQVRGRYRNDLEMLYLMDYNAAVNVPNEFMGRRLFSEDKESLCQCLKVKNKNGNLMHWTKLKERLIESGYAITEGRQQNYRYAIITY